MRINGSTQIFGLIGDPIAQVKTPGYINKIFEERELNIACIPFHISRDDLSSFWQGISGFKNVIGFGVTVPHKKQAMKFCSSLSASAEKLGVVNVVRRNPEGGGFHGENFDGLSFVNGLKAQGFDPVGHRVYMYGAGGAATAICFALIEAGVQSICIQNRTVENAITLAALLKELCSFNNIRVAEEFDNDATMVINASCLGMNENDPLPIDRRRLKPSQIVAEVVAKPEITELLKQAKEIGCPIHSGIHMITNQMNIMADFIGGQ